MYRMVVGRHIEWGSDKAVETEVAVPVVAMAEVKGVQVPAVDVMVLGTSE